ncbi:putative Holliday junction resolvase [Actinoplanes lutulentus]|uniref:Putative pre-16S rRNA nuclease n=1 Tax=Actinoplanes lutulentus TaxID=1287878 RepID=A0A327YZY6_9ACTN|nr:Holliday junction resolvase RuvX [Actinoplanes lutulentus]MBB2942973.1 putative Holliday junction resolvase [Actinoplanes lutulentus]RAK26759.1 putative Holliday junction resolvase [Actinoplanes lutulentus]
MTQRFVRGVRLGVDVGQVRVGVARCDPDGILASPVKTVARDQVTGADGVPADMKELAGLIEEFEAIEVVVGLPVALNGREGVAAGHIRAYTERLGAVIAPVPIVLTDERMSTVVASRRLSERGVKGRRQRAVVDQAAAVEILQGWLDARRRQS